MHDKFSFFGRFLIPTLNSIPAPDKISKEIVAYPDNVQAAAEAAKTVEEKLVGKDRMAKMNTN